MKQTTAKTASSVIAKMPDLPLPKIKTAAEIKRDKQKYIDYWKNRSFI